MTYNEDEKGVVQQILDRTDLENERMGLENTGRVKRFLDDPHGTNSADAKRQRRRDSDATLLEIMLRNRAYAESYERVSTKLFEAEQAVEAALAQAIAAHAQAEATLAELESRAARDPDNQAVFRDRNGQARYADGSAVDAVTASTILWNDSNPTYEQREDAHGRVEATDTAVTDLEHIRDEVLAPIHVEMDDIDMPPSQERLDEFEETIDAAEAAISHAQVQAIDTETTLAPERDTSADAIPNLEALGF